MKAAEYKAIIKRIVHNQLRKNESVEKSANAIAIAVHARLHGANVDGVENPLWREDEPIKTAKELMEQK